MALALPVVGWALTAYASLNRSKKQQVLKQKEQLVASEDPSSTDDLALVRHTSQEFSFLLKMVFFDGTTLKPNDVEPIRKR
jgi:hypothetical protein